MRRSLAIVVVVLVAAVAGTLLIGSDTDPAGVPTSASIVPPDPDLVYNPERAGEEMPPGYRQLLYRDQINPIYNPTFTTPENVNWPGDMLVIGVAGDAEAKAYPITPLNSREMVIDSLEGIPILVTW